MRKVVKTSYSKFSVKSGLALGLEIEEKSDKDQKRLAPGEWKATLTQPD
jgi:hypothetical protein